MIERPHIKGRVCRVAVVRALHLGDLLLALPAWRLLRQAFPAAEITLIGLPWAKDLARRFGYIDRVVEFPGYPGMLEVPFDEPRLAGFLTASRAYGYDLALQMHGSGETSAEFTASLGARYSVGYEPCVDGLDGARRLDFALPYPNDIVEIFRNLRLVEWLTGRPGDPHLEFPLLPEDHQEIAGVAELSRLPADGLLIGIHPGARPPARRWPAQRFAGLGDALSRQFGASIIVLGGPGEDTIVDDVVRRMETRPIALAGRISLGGLAALMTRLALFIGNDSGPAHLATAVDIPSVTIFGPADPRRWAPLNGERHRIVYHKVECSPCPYWDCPIDHRCLRRVSIDDVLEMAKELMRGAKAA